MPRKPLRLQTNPLEQIGHSEWRSPTAQVGPVERLAGKPENAKHVAPLTIGYFAAPAKPHQLSQHVVLWRGNEGALFPAQRLKLATGKLAVVESSLPRTKRSILSADGKKKKFSQR